MTAVVPEGQPFGRPAHYAIGFHGRDVARHSGVVEQYCQVSIVVVTLVHVQAVDGNSPSVRVEVGVHRVRVHGVVGRTGRRLYLDERVVVVGLEPELQRGHLVRCWPVDGRRRAFQVSVVFHYAPTGVLNAIVRHVHQWIADARKVLAKYRQVSATGRYAPERLSTVHSWCGRVHEWRIVHVLAQVLIELDPYRTNGRAVAGTCYARHLVLALR